MEKIYTNLYENIIYVIIISLIIKISQWTLYIALGLTILVFFIYFSQRSRLKVTSKSLIVFIILEIVLFIVQLFRVKNNNIFGITDYQIFFHYGIVFTLVLSLPIYEIINYRKETFFKKINIIGITITSIKTLSWLIYNFFHCNLGFTLLGGKEEWVRSIGSIAFSRMSGTFLDGFMFAFSVVIVMSSNSLLKKYIYALEAIFLYLYAGIVYQSRTLLIFYTFSLLVAVFYKNIHSNNKLKMISFLSIILIVFLVGREYLGNFISSFSLNGDNGASTYTRIVEYQYYHSLWTQNNINIWLGFGMQPDLTVVQSVEGLIRSYMSDIGIPIILYEFGIIGLLVALIPFINGFILMIKCFVKSFSRMNFFFITLTSYYLISISNFNPYYVAQYELLPIYIGIILYVREMDQ